MCWWSTRARRPRSPDRRAPTCPRCWRSSRGSCSPWAGPVPGTPTGTAPTSRSRPAGWTWSTPRRRATPSPERSRWPGARAGTWSTPCAGRTRRVRRASARWVPATPCRAGRTSTPSTPAPTDRSAGDRVVVQGALQGPIDLAEALGVVGVEQEHVGPAHPGPDLPAAAAPVVGPVDRLQQQVGQGGRGQADQDAAAGQRDGDGGRGVDDQGDQDAERADDDRHDHGYPEGAAAGHGAPRAAALPVPDLGEVGEPVVAAGHPYPGGGDQHILIAVVGDHRPSSAAIVLTRACRALRCR